MTCTRAENVHSFDASKDAALTERSPITKHDALIRLTFSRIFIYPQLPSSWSVGSTSNSTLWLYLTSDLEAFEVPPYTGYAAVKHG